MEQTNNPAVVGVRFSKVGKVYHFSANNITDVKIGDMVVVETSRGWQLGQVAQILDNPEPPPDGWKTVDRRATPRDLLLRQMWQMKESEVVEACHTRSKELRLSGVKIVSAEYSFDGSRLTILFSTETEEKYDLKSLRQDMQKLYGPSQVELRQVGPRDVAKVVCGMGACGLETRCCCLFLTEFSSISIRMAKEQGISLTPSEITGMCGRLRCCLIYEYDTYVDARSRLPKRNKRVQTPQGEGKVVDIVPLRNAVIVELPEAGNKEFPGDQVFLIDENAPPQPRPVVPVVEPQTPAEPEERREARPSRPAPQANPAAARMESQKQQTGPTTGDQPAPRSNRPMRPDRGRQGPPQQQSRDNHPPAEKSTSDPAKGQAEVKKDRPAQRWKKKPSGGAPGAQPSQQRPEGQNQPKPQAGSGETQARQNRENRRRRGHRRDNNEPQSGT